MKKHQTGIKEVLVIEPRVFKDERGWFAETYSKREFSTLGINVEFVQDNHSFSAQAGTVRGLHFQKNPYAQAKLIRCTKGAIRDVAVDLRIGSPTYCRWIVAELSSSNMQKIFVPRGFAHGYLTLEDDVEVQYKVDSRYYKESERCIRFDDPDIGIEWEWDGEIHISDKDAKAPMLKDVDCEFIYEG